MKKLITILAILTVLVGAVFADTADIRVSTTIGEVAPGFKLAYKALAEANGASYTSGTTGTVASSVVAGTPTKGEIVITTNDMLQEDAAITFSVIQTVDKARKTADYTLSASADALKLYQVPSTAQGGYSDYTGAQSANTMFLLAGTTTTATTKAATITGVDRSTYYEHGEAGTSVTFEFLGTPIPQNTEIATFTYQWNKNADAIPGKYQADVVLTITASR